MTVANTDRLGPGSALWRYLGDRRYLFMLPRSVCLLMLHPGIAAGITQHALMRDHIWLHKRRTVTQAVNIAYTHHDMAPLIRFSHDHVKGTNDLGVKYHALSPDIFHFQHAAYVETLVTMVNTFIRPLDAAEHEELYQDCCAWYRRYGISTRPMPDTWTEFVDYFEDRCRSDLSAGPHFERYRSEIFAPSDWTMRHVPRRAIRAMQHPHAQELLGIEVTAADRRSLRRFTRVSRLSAALPRHHWNAKARTVLRAGNRAPTEQQSGGLPAPP